MGKIKRGGYIILWWIGDHPPKHVHLFKDGKELAKITLPDCQVLSGKANSKMFKIIRELIKEGKLEV